MYPYDDEDTVMKDDEMPMWPYGVVGIVIGVILYFAIFHGNVVVAG